MAADRAGSRWEGWIVVGEEEGEEVEVKREQRSVSWGSPEEFQSIGVGELFSNGAQLATLIMHAETIESLITLPFCSSPPTYDCRYQVCGHCGDRVV